MNLKESSKPQKKVAFISGASRGIGAAIAKKFAAHGYHLILNCHSSAQLLEELKEQLQATYSIEVLSFVGDMGNSDFVEEMAKQIFQNFSHIDVVVNNAGISHIGLLTDMSYSDWDKILQTNLSSCFYTAKAFVPKMVSEKSGHIISISSIWGQCGASCEVAYSASKGGIDAFTKALAKELAPSHIQVNAISCGVIDTQMNECFSSFEREELKSEIPMDRFGTAEEVADAVYSLVSGSQYVTGQILGVNGGFF